MPNLKSNSISLLVIVMIVVGVVFQCLTMFKTGGVYDFGIGYWGPLARDGVWHEALVGQLLKSTPPINPGLAGQTLGNYHYYYDLVISLLVRLGIPSKVLIYQIFPVTFSVLVGIGSYKLSIVLFNNKKTALLTVFFAYFASSFGWIVEYIKSRTFGGESAFWANQPVSMNLNPPFAISLIIIIFALILIDSYLKTPKVLKALLITILSGTLIGFKVYAGVILLAGLFFLGVRRIIFEKDYKLAIIFFLSLGISLLIVLPQKDSVGLLEFNPFWLINTMIDAGDRVGIPNFTSRRFAYLGEHKWFHLFILQAICFMIFFVGNLGTRIVGIFSFQKKFLKSDLHLFVFVMMITSLIPPLLFTQKGNSWNIVQFFYYFLFFSGLYAASTLSKIPTIVAVLLLLITPVSSIATFRGGLYPNPPAYLSAKEHDALKYLESQEDGVVLKHNFDVKSRSKFIDPFPLSVYADNTYVSAHSGKSVFLEDVEQQIVLNTDFQNRLELSDQFFIEKDPIKSASFLYENNIEYIYLPKIYELPMEEAVYPMRKIFENGEVNIYKVVN